MKLTTALRALGPMDALSVRRDAMLRYEPHQDAYAILGVDPHASQEDVEKAFRRAALTWHPDKSPAPDAAERFLQVQRAGEALRDPLSRREYDRMRDLHVGARRPPRAAPAPEPPPEPGIPMRPPPDSLET